MQKTIKNFILKTFAFFKVDMEKSWLVSKYKKLKRLNQIDEELKVVALLSGIDASEYIQNDKNTELLSIVCFSFDRAFQLDALLGSFYDNVVNAEKIKLSVLYRTSSTEHEKAYAEVRELYKNKNLVFVRQSSKESFKSDLQSIVSGVQSKKIMFLVDDILFIEKVNLDEFASLDSKVFVPSLRLGLNTNYSYMLKREQKIPDLISISKLDIKDANAWKWSNGDGDWNYVMSVDGNIFSRSEMIVMMNYLKFASPNTFEYALWSKFGYIFNKRLGVCYKKSKIVNLPINHVMQESYTINEHGKVHQNDLLNMWNGGDRMDYKSLYGYNTNSAHEEIPFKLIKR
jgi:hypothetical protein